MESDLMTLNVAGPFREPREAAFSFDYSVQRPDWATAQGVRVKVCINQELDYFKDSILAISGGSAGQQLRINQILLRSIADRKLELVDANGMLNERLDIMVGPFVEDLDHLVAPLREWMHAEKDTIRQEIFEKIGI